MATEGQPTTSETARMTPSELLAFAPFAGDYAVRRTQLGKPLTIADIQLVLHATRNPDQPETWVQGLDHTVETELTFNVVSRAVARVRGRVQ